MLSSYINTYLKLFVVGFIIFWRDGMRMDDRETWGYFLSACLCLCSSSSSSSPLTEEWGHFSPRRRFVAQGDLSSGGIPIDPYLRKLEWQRVPLGLGFRSLYGKPWTLFRFELLLICGFPYSLPRLRKRGSISKMSGNGGFSSLEWEYIRRHHRHEPAANQCSSVLVKHIKAPVPLVRFLSSLFRCGCSCACVEFVLLRCDWV